MTAFTQHRAASRELHSTDTDMVDTYLWLLKMMRLWGQTRSFQCENRGANAAIATCPEFLQIRHVELDTQRQRRLGMHHFCDVNAQQYARIKEAATASLCAVGCSCDTDCSCDNCQHGELARVTSEVINILAVILLCLLHCELIL